MVGNLAGCRQPDVASMSIDVVQDLAELTQAIRLPQNEAMKHDAHDERPSLRFLEHLVELVDEVLAEYA